MLGQVNIWDKVAMPSNKTNTRSQLATMQPTSNSKARLKLLQFLCTRMQGESAYGKGQRERKNSLVHESKKKAATGAERYT
eukprot:188018-Ditylum_brightwellii.AAC.1